MFDLNVHLDIRLNTGAVATLDARPLPVSLLGNHLPHLSIQI